ncbi:group II intron reverse transcriptase/maturase [Bacillus rubiinfantis]|uniref:group II intron reverse transcriptase/maturase n=1 Tax=Bacillus rubiinfantis TaxID=1499680 RepID=UPI0005AB40AA|nr:group II intron reverse transcriptase/maturase [Bacillus rubiinfantis]
MQKAETVLGIVESKSKSDKHYKFDRLYRNLFNPDFYLHAYGKIYAKEENMTKGADEETIDGFGMKKVNEVIELIKNEQYHFKPVRRVYIPKKDGSKRPLGIPSFYDKVIQEISRSILEAIYEPKFSKSSHGFRPNRSCHTALKQVKREWTGIKWVIEGDIKGFFDNINHEILVNILNENIHDGRFLELIKRMLEAGYMEDWVFHKTYSGTPQGGIISPILANIYLNKLDEFVENVLIPKYETNKKKRKMNPIYNRINRKMVRLSKKIDDLKSIEPIRQELINEYQLLEIERRNHKVHDEMDSDFVRVKYVRYADDFIIGVIGSKELTEQIKKEVAEFLTTELKLTLSEEKTLITNFKNPVKFLGYEMYIHDSNTYLVKKSNGRISRAVNGIPRLMVPREAITKKLEKFTRNGKAVHRKELTNLDIAEIISIYASEVRGLYNYYRMADNVANQMNRFKHYHRTSLAKTIAVKMRTSVAKVRQKYEVDGTIGIVIKREPPKDDLIYKYYNDGFSKNDYVGNANDSDMSLSELDEI